MSKLRGGRNHSDALMLSVGDPGAISVRRVQALQGAAWSPDSRAIYTFSSDGRGTTLLLIGTAGDIRTLWRTDTHAEKPVPSPDGRHLAFANWTAAENVWLIDRR
jgi:hypothetical protein